MKKKLILTGGMLVAISLGIVGMSAFEAHVVNVTATIENALNIPLKSIEYGTVFPQEQLDRQVEVALSDSFKAEGRVEDVEYIIRQKPKCAITTNNGTSFDPANTATGHVSLDDLDKPVIDCGPAPRELKDGETWGVLPSLCEYLSKHKVDRDDQTQEVEIDAFHQPYTFAGHQVVWNEAKGYLVKPSDLSDTWNIDLKVPCFGGQCAQDWAKFVHDANPNADPALYTQPIANEHKVFGCDLWFEVTGVSRQLLDITSDQKIIGNINGAILHIAGTQSSHELGVANVAPPIADGKYAFKLQASPAQQAALTAYFGAKAGWTAPMLAQIALEISGSDPFFYLKATAGTYILIDRFKEAMGMGELPLVIDDDYPVGIYNYSGTIGTSVYNIPLTVVNP
jgi:hypothetical protein